MTMSSMACPSQPASLVTTIVQVKPLKRQSRPAVQQSAAHLLQALLAELALVHLLLNRACTVGSTGQSFNARLLHAAGGQTRPTQAAWVQEQAVSSSSQPGIRQVSGAKRHQKKTRLWP